MFSRFGESGTSYVKSDRRMLTSLRSRTTVGTQTPAQGIGDSVSDPNTTNAAPASSVDEIFLDRYAIPPSIDVSVPQILKNTSRSLKVPGLSHMNEAGSDWSRTVPAKHVGTFHNQKSLGQISLQGCRKCEATRNRRRVATRDAARR